jgi:arginyl-tRNA synthetase
MLRYRRSRSRVRTAIEEAWRRAVAERGATGATDGATLPAVEISRPANDEHGDLASNLALKLARPYRRAPLDIATALAAEIERGAAAPTSPIATVEVAQPGFLNLRLSDVALEETIDSVLAAPDTWGRVAPVRPRRVNVEFVSANPTGPLTISNARGAFIGDLLCRILEAGSQTVTRSTTSTIRVPGQSAPGHPFWRSAMAIPS